jgi:shikimate kinase
MLHEVTEFEDVVISCGGGTPCFFDNIDYMNSLAETVYLKAEPEVLRTHLLMAKSQRPLIQGKTPDELRDFIKESLANREPFYAKAKHIVQIEVLNSRELIDKYVDKICQELAL